MSTYLADRIREYAAVAADPPTAARARRELFALAVQVQRMELRLDELFQNARQDNEPLVRSRGRAKRPLNKAAAAP